MLQDAKTHINHLLYINIRKLNFTCAPGHGKTGCQCMMCRKKICLIVNKIFLRHVVYNLNSKFSLYIHTSLSEMCDINYFATTAIDQLCDTT